MPAAYNFKHKALEITMRDVMDSLEEAANYVALNNIPYGLEILSIEPATKDPLIKRKKARVFQLTTD